MPSQPVATPTADPKMKQQKHMSSVPNSNRNNGSLLWPSADLPDPVPPVVTSSPHNQHIAPDLEHNPSGVVEAPPFNKPRFNRVAYMREYMRKRRAQQRANGLPAR